MISYQIVEHICSGMNSAWLYEPVIFFGKRIYIFFAACLSIPVWLACNTYLNGFGVHYDEAVATGVTMCFIAGIILEYTKENNDYIEDSIFSSDLVNTDVKKIIKKAECKIERHTNPSIYCL